MARILTIPQKEDLKGRISELYLKGMGIGRMAKKISSEATYSVSVPTVSKHLKAVLKEWFDAREQNIELRINAELLRINEVEYQAWEAWQRSCKSKTKKTSKQKGTPKRKTDETGKEKEFIQADYISETEQVEEMVGDPRFLDIIAKCIDTRLQWITKGMDSAGNGRPATTNITNNTVLVMARQEKYIPEKLRTIQAGVVNADLKT